VSWHFPLLSLEKWLFVFRNWVLFPKTSRSRHFQALRSNLEEMGCISIDFDGKSVH